MAALASSSRRPRSPAPASGSADDDSCNQSCPCSISLYRTYVQKKDEEKLKGRLNIKLCYLPPESEEDQVFPSAVNMEFDVEESAPIGSDNEAQILEDESPEDNDEELDKPEFFEEEPVKNENIWSEEVEDEFADS